MQRLPYYFLCVSLGLLGGYLISNAFGPRMGFGPRGHRPPPLSSFAKELGLSAEQIDAIRTIEKSIKAHTSITQKQFETREEEFDKKLFAKTEISELKDAFNKLLESHRAAELEHFEIMTKVHQLLTETQLEKLKKMKQANARP